MALKLNPENVLKRAGRELDRLARMYLEGHTIGMTRSLADLPKEHRPEYHRLVTLAGDVRALRLQIQRERRRGHKKAAR